MIRDVRAAIEVIRERTGLRDLDLDASGHAELVLDKDVSVHLTRVSDTEIELAAFMPSHDDGGTLASYRKLLAANGEATGEARFGLDGDGRTVLSERLTLRDLSEDALDAAIVSFARRSVALRTIEDGRVAAPGSPPSGDTVTPAGLGSMMRI